MNIKPNMPIEPKKQIKTIMQKTPKKKIKHKMPQFSLIFTPFQISP